MCVCVCVCVCMCTRTSLSINQGKFALGVDNWKHCLHLHFFFSCKSIVTSPFMFQKTGSITFLTDHCDMNSSLLESQCVSDP